MLNVNNIVKWAEYFIGPSIGFFVSIFITKILLFFIFIIALNNNLKNSYISSVQTNKFYSWEIKKYIKEFDNYSETDTIKFKGGSREIVIKEKKLPKRIYGLANIKINSCTIYLNSNSIRSSTILKLTTYHELLHCYGFQHVYKNNDLMSRVMSYNITKDNIKKWALRLEEKLYGN